MRIVAIALLVVAAARPQLGRAEVEIPAEGIDIVLTLDTSFSMKDEDFGSRSKIDVAKDVVIDFVKGLRNDRVGLVLFSGEGVTQSPLTLDYQAFQTLVRPVEAGVLPGGTAIGMGLAQSLNLLRDSRAKSKVIVLLTDGENNSGDISPLDAAQMARLLKIKVYTIGAVGAGERSRFSRSAVDVDERLMRQISEMTGGAYLRATNESSLREIYRQIAELEKTKVGGRKFSDFEELNLFLVLPALLLLVAEVALRNTLLRKVP